MKDCYELDILASLGAGMTYFVEGSLLGDSWPTCWKTLRSLEDERTLTSYNGRIGYIVDVDWEDDRMSFKLDELKAAVPAWLNAVPGPTTVSSGSISVGVGTGNMTGTATVPIGSGVSGTAVIGGVLGQNYMITTGGSITVPAVTGYNVISKPQSDSADLPDIVMEADEAGRKVTITLAPDSHLSAQEALKIMMLLMASATEPESFNALNYIKKNNLERHFKYA